MRTREKIPLPFEGSYGPFIRTVSSIDGSTEVYRTQPAAYVSMTKTTAFKYNKQKYYWYMNGYLYLPNVEWDAVQLEGIFQDDISIFTCNPENVCKVRQTDILPIPDDLFAEVEKQVLGDLGGQMQVPVDTNISDKQNILR
jgi:activator of HSP90 ATPase